MKKSKIISARVPEDVAELLDKACKRSGESRNAYLGRIISSVDTSKPTNDLQVERSMPDVTKTLISALGGVGAGTIVYKILDSHLPRDRWEDDERQSIVNISTIAAALIAGVGIHQLLKDS